MTDLAYVIRTWKRRSAPPLVTHISLAYRGEAQSAWLLHGYCGNEGVCVCVDGKGEEGREGLLPNPTQDRVTQRQLTWLEFP